MQLLAMNPPTLYAPANNSTLNAFDAFLWGTQVTGATGYQVQYDTTSNFSSTLMKIDSGAYPNLSTNELYMGRNYYWRARAYKSGDTSAWTATWTFRTALWTLTNYAPADQSSGTMKRLQINASGSTASIQYQFEMDSTPSFNSALHVKFVRSTASAIDTNLFQFGKNVYWHARSFNSRGDTTGWSVVWKYTFYTQPAISGSTGLAMVDPLFYPGFPTTDLAGVQLQLDTLSSFNTGSLIQHNLAPGSIRDTLRNLMFGRAYFYRIRAVFGNSYSAWSLVRNIKVYANGNLSTPYTGQVVGLINNINFSWGSMQGVRFRFQLFSDSLYSLVMKDTLTDNYFYTYRTQLELNRKYYFKIRYMHALDTAPWLQSWFITYTGQVNLGSPFDAAVNQPVRLRFNFQTQSWAYKHVLEIDTGTSFGPNRSRFFIQTDTFKYDGFYYHYADTILGYGKRYVWRVYAIRVPGDTAQPTVRTLTTRAAPVNYFPPNNYIGTGTQTNALITGIDGSRWVQWQLDTSANFNSPVLMDNTAAHIPDSFDPSHIGIEWPGNLYFAKKYYWRTRCINALDTSAWSAPFNFITTQDVWATNPPDKSVNRPLRDTLRWGIQGSNFDYRYQYQAGTDSMFGNTPIITLPLDAFAEAPLLLQYGTTYFWRARATHPKDTSKWSPVFRFRTIDAPVIPKPYLTSPVNGSTGLSSSSLLLKWSTTTNAFSYDVQVAGDTGFTQMIASGSPLSTSVTFSNPHSNKRYYWRVRGTQGSIIGPWSDVNWFEMGIVSGLADAFQLNSIQIYPNPACNEVHVFCEGKFEIRITDMQGRTIYESSNNIDNITLNTDFWNSGIYQVELKVEQHTLFRKLAIEH